MVNTPPVPPGRPEEQDDPTGVRALLSGLGDPGPMPADLVDRINASIAAEQRSRAAGSDGTVVPLRRRRPSWPRIGLAAAAVAAIAVAVPAALGTGPGDLMASLSGSLSRNASDSAASGSAESRADSGSSSGGDSKAGSGAEPVRPSSGNRAAGGTGTVVLASTGTAYTSSQLTTQARTVLARGDAAADTSRPPVASEQGLRACLTALGVASWMPVNGDVGTYDGRPAVVAVVSSDTGQSVYAVDPGCDATHPTVIAGPVPLP